ncbi:MAG TPA: S-layer homology domain-containing protein, partial [Planctomycetaceae bacterium]
MLGTFLLALVLALSLLGSGRPAAAAEVAASGEASLAGQAAYRDLSGHWAEEAVVAASLDGTAYGFADGTFRPDEPVSRLDVAVTSLRTLGLAAAVDAVVDATAATGLPLSFTDLGNLDLESRAAIAVAGAAGLLVGDAGGETFRPEDGLSRAETATIIVRALGLEGEAKARGEGEAAAEAEAALEARFADAAGIPAWARGYVAVALETGLIEGYAEADGRFTFRADRSTSRAE